MSPPQVQMLVICELKTPTFQYTQGETIFSGKGVFSLQTLWVPMGPWSHIAWVWILIQNLLPEDLA